MVDDNGWKDDGQTPDHGHPISSPCEPNGSGELKKREKYCTLYMKYIQHNLSQYYIHVWINLVDS